MFILLFTIFRSNHISKSQVGTGQESLKANEGWSDENSQLHPNSNDQKVSKNARYRISSSPGVKNIKENDSKIDLKSSKSSDQLSNIGSKESPMLSKRFTFSFDLLRKSKRSQSDDFGLNDVEDGLLDSKAKSAAGILDQDSDYPSTNQLEQIRSHAESLEQRSLLGKRLGDFERFEIPKNDANIEKGRSKREGNKGWLGGWMNWVEYM